MPTAWWGISYAAVALVLHLGGAIAWLVLLFCDCPTKRGCCGALCAKPLCDACRSRAHGCDCGARDAAEAYTDGPAPVASAAASTLDRRPIAVRCTPPPVWSLIPVALGVAPLAVLALIVISIAMGPAEAAPGEPLSMLVPGASFSATLAVFEGVAALVGVALATLAAVAAFVPFRDGKSCAATCGESEKAGKCGACIDTFAHLLRLKLAAGLCAVALFLSAFAILVVLLCAQMFIGRRGFELVHVLGLVLGHLDEQLACALDTCMRARTAASSANRCIQRHPTILRIEAHSLQRGHGLCPHRPTPPRPERPGCSRDVQELLHHML